MTAEDRDRAGLSQDDSSVYFSLVRDKANLAPPGKREWRRVVSVELANGDSVGVVERWDWPDDFADLSGADLKRVQSVIAAAKEPLRYSDQTAPWVGTVVAGVLGLDAVTDRKRIKRMIETWMKNRSLVKVSCDLRRPPQAPLCRGWRLGAMNATPLEFWGDAGVSQVSQNVVRHPHPPLKGGEGGGDAAHHVGVGCRKARRNMGGRNPLAKLGY